MREYTKFYITPKRERAALSGHPWVYAEEITRIEGEYQNGDLVDVVTNKGKYQFVASRQNKRDLARIIFNREHDYPEL